MVKYIPYKQLFIYYKSRKNEGVHMEINIGIRGFWHNGGSQTP